MLALRIESVRRIVEDENHNAFTDLIRFGDRLYLSYRMSPRGHLAFEGSWGVIIVSDDNGETWRESFRFSVPNRDVRDPHLVVLNGRLFAYAGTWLVEEKYDVNHHLGYTVWTDAASNGMDRRASRGRTGTTSGVAPRMAARSTSAQGGNATSSGPTIRKPQARRFNR